MGETAHKCNRYNFNMWKKKKKKPHRIRKRERKDV